MRAAARGFDLEGGRLRAILTDLRSVPCDRTVIAAGIRSRLLAAAAGDRVLLAAARGYHVEVTDPGITLSIPVMPSDGRMGNTVTEGGLRAPGQVELADPDAPPNWKRAKVLLDHLRRTYPALPAHIPADRVSYRMGSRPSTPDGLPVIGPSRACSGILHGFGHGHVGLAAGPITGRLVADAISGRAPEIPLGPYSVARFRHATR